MANKCCRKCAKSAPAKTAEEPKDQMIWAYLIHLGYNMWGDREVPELNLPYWTARPYLRCEQEVWTELTQHAADAGLNTIVIDLGEGVKYESHPELAVKGSWSVSKLKKELARLRKLGLEPVPKMNFSACHDMWLGPYSRCLSTPTYYGVVRDLIAEAIDIFDKPRFFHIGMDEEDEPNQRYFDYAIMRQHELWWHDLNLFVDQVEAAGARAWVWSDYVWSHPEVYLSNMRKSVVQNNWYYGKVFNKKQKPALAYMQLEEAGFDQIPTSSNWSDVENTELTLEFCKKHIAPERLLGFFQSVWRPTLAETRDTHIAAIDLLAQARQKFYGEK